QRDRRVGEVAEVGEPAFGVRGCGRENGEETFRIGAGEPRDEDGRTRSGQPGDGELFTAGGNTIAKIESEGSALERVQQKGKTHVLRRRPLARPTSIIPSISANQRSGPCRLARPAPAKAAPGASFRETTRALRHS